MKDNYTFEELLNIMNILRSKDGCPWDREQTHETLKRYLIEECYEVIETIDLKDKDKMCEELGDVLLQVIFHSQIAKEAKTFDINDVITNICKKMISRHGHVFGETKLETAEQVLDVWEKNKKVEKGQKTQTEVLKSVPSVLPALIRAYKVQSKAAKVGFDWDNIEDVFDKIEEELIELKNEIKLNKQKEINEEMGDLLFAVVNLSRYLKVFPELALTGTTEKFINRFEFIESEGEKMGKYLEDMTLKEMDELWDRAKIECKKVDKSEN